MGRRCAEGHDRAGETHYRPICYGGLGDNQQFGPLESVGLGLHRTPAGQRGIRGASGRLRRAIGPIGRIRALPLRGVGWSGSRAIGRISTYGVLPCSTLDRRPIARDVETRLL